MERRTYASGSKGNEIVIGVHFGRDYVRYAVSENGHLNVIPNSIGQLETPLVIGFNEKGEILIGKEAIFGSQPSNTLFNLPNIIGKTYNQLKEMKDFPFQYEIVNRHNKPLISVKVGEESFEQSVEEVLSPLFKDIKTNTQNFMNMNVSCIVLSVPDSFDEDQVMSLKAAANKGGLDVVKVLKDSEAAIHGYELSEAQEDKNILIVSMGKESTDIVFNVAGNGNVELIGKKTLEKYGESTFDKVVEDYLTSSNFGLQYKAESLREELTVFHSLGGVTRAKYDELISAPLKDLLMAITSLLVEAEMKRTDVSDVILFGSLFNVVKLRREISDYFYGMDLKFRRNAEEIIAEGTAIIAFKGRGISVRQSVVLLNLLQSSLGIEVYNGIFEPVVVKGSVIPIKVCRQFTTAFDNQSKVYIRILEGNRPVARTNDLLGEITFEGISKGLRSFILFNVEFDVRRDGSILFTVTDIERSLEKKLLITKNYDIYSSNDGSGMVDQQAAEKDENIRVISGLRFQLESVLYEIRSHITKNTEIIRKIKSPVDLLILTKSVQESIFWLENNFTPETEEMEELKIKFESTIKPILARTFKE